MSDIVTINVLNQNLIAVQGTAAKQVLVETTVNQDAGALRTFLSLTRNSAPENFDNVFSSLVMQTENGVDNRPFDMTGPYSSFQYGFPEGFSQPIGYGVITDINPVIAAGAPEGDYVIHVEMRDVNDTVVSSTDVSVKIVSVETALFQYESMLQELSDAEIAEIEAKYAELESLRQVVNSAILSLPAEQQPALMDRYYSAAGNQYSSFKLIKLYNSKDNELNVARVKNLGGNAPFSIVFKDSVCIGDASEAYLFYPEGYRAAQTGISLYPSDQPDNIEPSLMPGQTSYAVSNNYVHGGKFVMVFKVADTWFRATYEMSEDGTQLIAVNDSAIDIPNAGDEWLSPLEAAMKNAVTGTILTGSIDPDAADLDEAVVASITANYPVFDAAIDETMLVDVLVSSNKVLPLGTKIALVNNSSTIGTYTVSEAGVTSFFVSNAYGVSRTALNLHSVDNLVFTITDAAPGEYDLTFKAIAAKEGEFEIETSSYVLASFTEGFKVVDRRAALDAVIAGTSMSFDGDVIRSVGETVEIAVTTTYPAFSPDLDPSLAVDTLLTLNKPIPVGATIEVLAGAVSLGTYTELTGTAQSIWLNDIINAANFRPALADRNGQTIAYTFVFTGLVDSDYALSLKTITALQPNFETIDARYVLASVDVPMTVTDKSILAARISEAEGLLVTHALGEQPGNVAQVPRMTLQAAIDHALVVQNDGDASRNSILNEITALEAAIAEFKTYVVKWRTNKAPFQSSIDTAEDLLAATTVGTGVGQSSAESIATYQAAYNAAFNTLQTVPDFVDYFDADSFNAYQAQLDAAKASLDAATAVFQEERVSTEDYALAKITEYETAARAFYDSVRKKIRI